MSYIFPRKRNEVLIDWSLEGVLYVLVFSENIYEKIDLVFSTC